MIERRGPREYCYSSERAGGRVRRVYRGHSEAALAAAREQQRRRSILDAERAEVRRAEQARDEAISPLAELDALLEAATRAVLEGLGYRRHARGEWRLRRREVMGEQKVYPAELRAALERASRGEAGAMPAVSAAMDAHPELIAVCGDIARKAEEALLGLATGSCLPAREAITRELRGLRERLNATAGTELERLLVGRLSLDWLALQHAQIDLTAQLERSGTSLASQAAQRRLDRAHARFLASSKTLATVGKLLRRAPSPLDLLRMTGDAQAPAASRERPARRFEMPAAAAN